MRSTSIDGKTFRPTRLRPWFLLTWACVVLAGCVIAHKPAEVDPKTGNLPTFNDFTKDVVKTDRPFPGIKRIAFVYVRTDAWERAADFDAVVRDSLRKIGFTELRSTEDMLRLAVSTGLADQIEDVTHILSLARIAKRSEPFLVAEFSLQRQPNRLTTLDVLIRDPLTAEPYLHLSNESVVLLDIDREFTFPAINTVRRWHEESLRLAAGT